MFERTLDNKIVGGHSGPTRRRRGFSAVVATFYVALFSGLALAFVAFTSLNSEITGNTRKEQSAYLAAESGLSILRHHIERMTFDEEATTEQIFVQLGDDLADVFNNTLNMLGRQVTHNPDQIVIPPIATDTALPGDFVARLTRQEGQYTLTVTGRCNGVTRTACIAFAEQIGLGDDSILRHGIASQGAIRLDGAARIRSNVIGGGSVISLDSNALRPIRVNGSGQFDGDFYMVQEGLTGGDVFSSSTSSFLMPDGSGYETDVDAHTHSGVTEPAWPTVDTAPFVSLINSLPHTRIERDTDIGALGPLHNLYIAANADPVFSSGITIEGLVYVEWPNDLTFNGSANITGMIICEPPPYEPSLYEAATNRMTFRGAVTSSGVENLPQTPEYAGLHEHTRTFLLAPDVQVTFNGAIGVVSGTIYASELDLHGTTTGTIRGAIMVDRRRQFTKLDSVDILFEVDETQQGSAGLVFEQLKTLTPVPGSYQELSGSP